MSDQKDRSYELVDVDGDDDWDTKVLTTALTTTPAKVTTTTSSTTDASHTHRNDDYHTTTTANIRLPDGRIIDCKNTMQSFDTLEARPSHQTLPPPPPPPPPQLLTPPQQLRQHQMQAGNEIQGTSSCGMNAIPLQAFTLPNGQTIDAKNTLQSFATTTESPITARVYATSSMVNKNYDTNDPQTSEDIQPSNTGIDDNNNDDVVGTDLNNETPAIHQTIPTNVIGTAITIPSIESPTSNRNANIPNNAEGTVHAEAVAVVDAEIAADVELVPIPQVKGTQNTLTIVAIMGLIILIAIAAGVGGYCGSGKCNNNDNDKSPIPIAPTTPPVSMNPISLLEQQLTVACDFISSTNISQCQTTTSFNGRVTGSIIPTELGLLTQLTFLDLNSNQLTGTIPSTLGLLTQLNGLGLSRNQLNGIIPSTLGQLTQLNDLFLYDNQLTGTIPSTLGQLVQLTFLDFNFNELNGTIPSILGQLTQLNGFFLSSNQLTGTIPSTLGQLTQLNYWYLDNNQLIGTIPSTLGQLTRLIGLDMYGNQLNGTIPSTLCSVSGIEILIDCDEIVCSCCLDGDSATISLSSCPL